MKPVRPVPRLLWLLLVAAGLSSASVAAEEKDKDFPGIVQLMSAEDFARAGLAKLTPTEIDALDDWLVRYTAGEAQVVHSTSAEVKRAVGDFRIVAHVLPPFTGWTGQTMFRLDNGQAWRQRIKGRYSFSGSDPEVVITRNALGFYVMTLTSTGRSIGVEPAR